MFDDPASFRTTARRYRRAASQTSDRDVIHVFNAVADQYELKAVALEIERQNGTILRAWTASAACYRQSSRLPTWCATALERRAIRPL